MSVALSQSARFAIGFHKQADLVTPLIAADMVSMQLTNDDYLYVRPINESNRDDKGKGVYATALYKSHLEASGAWNGLLTAEAASICASFGVKLPSKVATTAAGGFKYTITAPNFAVSGLDLPSTTGLIQVGSVVDKAVIGVCCEEWGIQLERGAGRQNAKFTSQWKGTGQYADPSTITMPAPYAEHGLNAGGISALTLVGFDYLSNDRFVSAAFNWKNAIRDGFFPGSGSQDGYQIQGRMRRGTPEVTLNATVECDSGSSEEDALLAQTEGTGVINIEGDQIAAGPEKQQFKITFHRLRVKTAPLGDTDGIASYNVEYEILEHSANGVLTIECITTLDEIGEAA